MQTRTFRNHYNRLVIKSTYNLTLKDKAARLHITTTKADSGYLNTTASVCWPKQEGQYESETFMVFQDYMQRLAQSNPARVTEKVAGVQHSQVLAKLEEILKAVEAHYLP